jgi:hypothetical protein
MGWPMIMERIVPEVGIQAGALRVKSPTSYYGAIIFSRGR